MPAFSLGNTAILTKKTSLTTVPVERNRALIVEETRELYFDNDNGERFKLRDIQILNKKEDMTVANPQNNDLFFIKETLEFWFYLDEWINLSGKYVLKEEGKSLLSDTEIQKLSTVAENANNYSHPTHTSRNMDLYKIEVDSLGHITKAEAIDYAIVAGKSIFTITGDGNKTSFTLTHNKNSYYVEVEVHDAEYETVYPTIKRTSMNEVTVSFKNAVTNGTKYYVTVF